MGVSVVTTVQVAAASYDLTDIDTIKDDLGITDNATNVVLQRYITSVSAFFKKYSNITFHVESLTDLLYIDQDPYPYQTPGGVQPLQLSRFPIVSVASVNQIIASATVNGVTTNTLQPLAAGTDYQLDAKNGQLIRLNPFTGVQTAWEALPVIVQYSAGYGALATEAGTVPASSPYQITAENADQFAIDYGVSYANGPPLVAVAISPAVGQYSQSSGTYTFNPGDASASVSYKYAYTIIPADIADAALRLVNARFNKRLRDPNVKQENIPGVIERAFWIDTGSAGNLPPDIREMLDVYRVPVVA